MKTILTLLTAVSLASVVSFEARSEEITTTQTTQTTTVGTFSPEEKKVIRQRVTVNKNSGAVTKTTTTKITRGEVLPVIIYKEATPIAQDVIVALPTQPESTKLVLVGDKVVRVSEPSHKILDVMELEEYQDKVEDEKR